jgi:hypothetical protein
VKEKLRKRKEIMILENKRVCARGGGVKERQKREKISHQVREEEKICFSVQ